MSIASITINADQLEHILTAIEKPRQDLRSRNLHDNKRKTITTSTDHALAAMLLEEEH